jgi:hypothetical protein
MKTIWKFQFEVDDNVSIEMPIDAEILTVDTQHEIPCLWALVDSEKDTIKRKFRIYGTGHPIVENKKEKYIGTFQLYKGDLIYHLFEQSFI